MEIIKYFIRGQKKGIYAITRKEQVTDALLDSMNSGELSEKLTKDLIENHLDKGLCFIPKNSECFDWNEEIHGKFFID